MNDVGLLAYLYMGGIQLKILDDDLPIEAKSGSDFQSHTALGKLMKADEYGIRESWVLSKFAKVWSENGITYLSIYFLMFFHQAVLPEKMVWKVERN